MANLTQRQLHSLIDAAEHAIEAHAVNNYGLPWSEAKLARYQSGKRSLDESIQYHDIPRHNAAVSEIPVTMLKLINAHADEMSEDHAVNISAVKNCARKLYDKALGITAKREFQAVRDKDPDQIFRESLAAAEQEVTGKKSLDENEQNGGAGAQSSRLLRLRNAIRRFRHLHAEKGPDGHSR